MIERVIVAGGGTGGHLFPGIAVVEELSRRNPDLEVVFVGTDRGIESRVVPQLGYELERIEVSPLKGRTAGELLRSVAALPGAAARAMAILRAHRPDLVIGVGGYASGPILAAAAARGIPTAILEQNAHVGLTNRMLARVIGRAYVTFPETAASFGAKRARVSGNPVRRAFVEAARRAHTDPEGAEARARRVFVLGGSQGSQALNQTVPEALAGLGLDVLHQTGAAMRDEVEARYRALGVRAEVVPFIDEMAAAYGSAALVIARAGATTVAELCAVGRPSVLIPYPFAANDHQRKNAEALEREGAAICIPQDTLDPQMLATTVRGLMSSPDRRRAMSESARRFGRPDAAASIVDDLCDWLGCPDVPLAQPVQDEAPRGGSTRANGDPEARRVALRGHRPYVPAFRTEPRASARETARRPVLVYE